MTLSNVALVDDLEGTLVLSDVAGDGVTVLAVGDTETASSAHVVTQAEFDAGTLINIATADGDSPLGVNVLDTDTQTVTFAQNPAIDVVKSQALTTDNNLNGLPDVGDTVTYGYTVENTGDVTLSNVALVDDLEGTLVLSDVAGDGVTVLAVGDTETASSAHVVTQAEFDAGTLINIATADGDSPLGVNVLDTDTQTVTFAQNPAIDVVKSQALTTDNNLNGLPDVGDTVTYGYTVENTGDVTLSNVALVDDLEGTLVLSDVAGDGVTVLAVGDTETCELGPRRDPGRVRRRHPDQHRHRRRRQPAGRERVRHRHPDGDLRQNPAIDVVKSRGPRRPRGNPGPLRPTTDNNLNGLPDVGDTVTYGYTVENTGVTLSNVAVNPGPLHVAGDGVTVLAVGDTETAMWAHGPRRDPGRVRRRHPDQHRHRRRDSPLGVNVLVDDLEGTLVLSDVAP